MLSGSKINLWINSCSILAAGKRAYFMLIRGVIYTGVVDIYRNLLFLTFSALVANPKKTIYTVANSARGLLNRKKKKKKEVWQRPPPHAARSEKINIKITRRIHMSRRYTSQRYAGLGPSRVRTRIRTTRQLGQWVLLRKILRLRVR